jgi:amylosucrase
VALERGDPAAVDLSLRRLLLAYTLVLGFGGVPVLWMGDELALLNDPRWQDDPAHAGDNRWVHRPRMDWQLAARRHHAGTVEQRMWTGLRDVARVRARQPVMHASVEPEPLEPADPGVFGFLRRASGQTLVALHNMTDTVREWPHSAVPLDGALLDVLAGAPPEALGGLLRLEPYAALWLVPVTG